MTSVITPRPTTWPVLLELAEAQMTSLNRLAAAAGVSPDQYVHLLFIAWLEVVERKPVNRFVHPCDTW